MGRWQPAVGVLCGIGLWMLLGLGGGGETPLPRPGGSIVPECEGALAEVVIQYTAEATFAREVYRQLLPQLPAGVTVSVVCPDAGTFAELERQLGQVPCRVRPIIANHAMTTWSRDRWVALWDGAAGRTTLVAPAQEEGSASWPGREGDERIAFTIAAAEPRRQRAWRSPLLFDGGDLLADGHAVFATPAVVSRNLQHTVESRDELMAELARVAGRGVTLLEDVPEHHAGMFMMAVGERVMLVGDPGLAKSVWESEGQWPESVKAEAWRPDFSEATQAKFDNAAQQAEAAGYRVVRVPTVPGVGSKAYLTYLNVLMDFREGRKVVYMPVYRGVEAVNAAARAVWERAGFEVRPIDCTEVFPQFGTLHCLVNVVRRERGGMTNDQ